MFCLHSSRLLQPEAKSLGVITVEVGQTGQFEERFFNEFGKQGKIRIDFVPSVETVRSRLEMYQELFRRHSPQPDLFEIDVVWPAILADDLLDLTPYFQKEIKEFDPEVLRNFMAGGRLVALPTFLDAGVLYYRPDLLRKYGFQKPPATWEELGWMARQIQAGERRLGNRDFWGYVWQGGCYEALTCNAMEWQASSGGQTFLSSERTIHVRNPQTISALRRAASWIGTISPPGEAYYRELDSMNLWNAGDAAFMREWVSAYSTSRKTIGSDRTAFRLASLPGGPGGQRGTLGGFGMGVSKFCKNCESAIEALRGLTSQRTEEQRALVAGTIPSRIAPRNDLAIMAKTALPGNLAEQIMGGLVSRPSRVTGRRYAAFSKAYYTAVHSVLTREATPDAAMETLEAQLVAMSDFRPVH